MLGHSSDPTAQAYLRELYERDPERRGFIAMSLAEHPDGDNWPVLVKSLSVVEGAFAQQVLLKLATVDRKAEGPGTDPASDSLRAEARRQRRQTGRAAIGKMARQEAQLRRR